MSVARLETTSEALAIRKSCRKRSPRFAAHTEWSVSRQRESHGTRVHLSLQKLPRYAVRGNNSDLLLEGVAEVSYGVRVQILTLHESFQALADVTVKIFLRNYFVSGSATGAHRLQSQFNAVLLGAVDGH